MLAQSTGPTLGVSITHGHEVFTEGVSTVGLQEPACVPWEETRVVEVGHTFTGCPETAVGTGVWASRSQQEEDAQEEQARRR